MSSRGTQGPAHEPVAPDYWDVHFLVPVEELSALKMGLAEKVPSERRTLRTDLSPDGTEGDSTLTLEVRATLVEEATQVATEIFTRARLAGDLLPVRTPAILGTTPPAFKSDPTHRLLEEAERLFHDGRLELAVVRAQTAAELYAKLAIDNTLIRVLPPGRNEPARRLCRAGLRHDNTQDVLEALTGRRSTREWWWPLYEAHVRRRNEIVHRGVVVDRASALNSLEAVRACIDWLRATWEMAA